MNSCADCQHSEPTITDDNEDVVLTCRRYPPQVFMMGEQTACAWPQVDDSDCCGEWSDGVATQRPGDRILQLLGLKA